MFNRHMAMMRELKTAGVRASHPDWSERRVQTEVADPFRQARSKRQCDVGINIVPLSEAFACALLFLN